VQWRFHPHACPTSPREHPFGYTATAASSWLRSNIRPGEMNSRGLVCDFIEDRARGERSFKDRMFDPAKDGACLNQPAGRWTEGSDHLRLNLKILRIQNNQVTFRWRMEFNGWAAEQEATWDKELVPRTIDSVVIGYTNPRNYESLKLQRVA